MVQGEGPFEDTGSTVTLCHQQCLVRLDVRSFTPVRLGPPGPATPAGHVSTLHPVCSHTLWAAEIPYLLQRPHVYSQGCFPRVSGPETQKKAQILSGKIKDSLEQEEESSAQELDI